MHSPALAHKWFRLSTWSSIANGVIGDARGDFDDLAGGAVLEVTLPERLPVTAAYSLVLTGRPRSTAAATD